jgi:peptidoglycan/xylan/chitin deacetylase (PgdA/CDA1 family)
VINLLVLHRSAEAVTATPSGRLHPILKAVLDRRSDGRGFGPSDIRRTIEQVKALTERDRDIVCAQAAALAQGEESDPVQMISAEEMQSWVKAGMEVGSHTVTHKILSRLAPRDRRRELLESREWLEQALLKPVRHLAYPNGGFGDWDQHTIEDAKSAGYISAVTTIEGINNGRSNLFCLKRISVGDDPLPIFVIRVSGLLSQIRAIAKKLQITHSVDALPTDPESANRSDV